MGARFRAMRLATTLPTLVLLLAAVPAEAQRPSAEERRGLDAIRVENVRADVQFLADPAMGGRDTPSPGLRTAARFLRARLQRLGFRPAGVEGSWFHTYPVADRRIDVEDSFLALEGPGGVARLRFGEDYFVYSQRHVVEHDLFARVVAIGDGDRDELEGVELEGVWALAVDLGNSATRRTRNAERAGAGGLIVLPDPDGPGDPFHDRLDTTAQAAIRGSASLLASSRKREDPLPTVYLSRDGARRLLEAAGLAHDGVPPAGTPLELEVRERRAGPAVADVENVCALCPGSDPELAREVVIVCAHYDHVGVGDEGVFPGADDNASGSAGLLALAEGLAAQGPLRRSVLLLWVSGEEKGLWGSAAWTREPTLPEGSRAVCALNVDMIGRNAPDSLQLTPGPEHPARDLLAERVTELAPLEGFPELLSADAFWERSDHVNFRRNMGLPVAFLFAGEHEDYHRPTDTADRIDYEKLTRVSRLLLRVIQTLQDDELGL